MGISGEFYTWIAALYSEPTASVKVNGALSCPFRVRNGTRQGCPLSPLLFALSLEPFLESIRNNIQGIPGRTGEHKVGAYADDLLFFVASPLESLPAILEEFRIYGELANLQINMLKSEILDISVPTWEQTRLKDSFRFRWCEGAMSYLGIRLPARLDTLFEDNFPPLWRTLTAELLTWSKMHISWFGRISVLKMNVLPRLLYLFQTLPIRIPTSFFALMKSAFLRFVWRASRPRVRWTVLVRAKSGGGVALPDPHWYYIATHLLRVIEWSTGG
uniref:Reverse transcriptase domain-containing protein n=1 Tax=Leptobrachium leishanense TaxID=445787 RepID=A0A8C5LSC9_9ANUR